MAKKKQQLSIDPLNKPATVGDLKSLVQALGPLIRDSVREEVSDALRPLLRDLERLEAVSRETLKFVTDALMLERQRLAKERDIEHRRVLGGLDLARRPDRPGATPEQLRDAALASSAFVAGAESARQANAQRQPGEPETVNAEVVEARPLPPPALPEDSTQ